MYEFATGVINVWEKQLLSRLDQERMLRAPDKASSFMVLFDTDLGEIIAGDPKKNIEDVFFEDISLLKKRLNHILDDKGLLASFLFLKFDGFNLKSALKKHFFKDKTNNFEPFHFSLEPYENLANKIQNNGQKGKFANFYVEKLVEEAMKNLNGGEDIQKINSQKIEIAVDRAYFKVKLSIAKKESVLTEMVRLEIDVANLRCLLAKSNQQFLNGGNLDAAQIAKLAQKKEGDSGDSLKKFLEILELAFLIDSNGESAGDIVLERKLEAYMAQKIFQKEKEKGSGIEKVLAFFQRKINSYANIRLILFAKENGLEVEEIEKALLPI